MPQFEMNGKTETEYTALPEIVQGFIEAMFFTESSNFDSNDWFSDENQEALANGELDGNLPSDVGFNELHQSAIDMIISYCATFEASAGALLDSIRDGETDNYDMERVGNDLWYTSNGHGVGFWCRDEIEADGLGDKLSDLCRHNEFNAYYSEDGFIYLD